MFAKLSCNAAVIAALALASPAAAQVRLQSDRWAEDWSGQEAAFKDMAFGPFRVDLGMDARWKAEGVASPRFSLSSQEDDSWLQQRLNVHANLSAGDTARLFVQLGANDVFDRTSPSANDENQLDVQQAFLDWTPDIVGWDTRLRIGRQEFGGGSRGFAERFIDVGDSSAVRRRWDAARLTLRNDDWLLDAVSFNPIENDRGAFDDSVVEGEHIFGALLQREYGDLTLRGYAFDHAREAFALAGVTANDRRVTYGLLLTLERGPYAFEADIVRQQGDHGAYDVSAWGGFVSLTRAFEDAPGSPSLEARVTYGSGDSDPLDSVIETYAPPIPRGSWFNEGGFFSHSNIVEAAVVGAFSPVEYVTFNAKLAGVWRSDAGDFVYASTHTALAGTRGGDSFIGVAPRLQMNWRVSPHVTVRGELASVFVSDYIETLGGEDSAYANLSLTLSY